MADHQIISSARRRVLQTMFGGSLLALIAGGGWIMEKFIAPVAGEVLSIVAGRIADFSDAATVKFFKLGMKDIMLRRTGTGIAALDLKCSHAGCTVHWQPEKNIFHCPCHGGEYDAAGKVLKGPPPKPLAALRVSVSGAGEITVTDLPA